MSKMKNMWIVALCFVLVSPILVKGDCGNIIIEGVITDISDSQITVDDVTVIQVTEDTEITITKKGDKIPFEGNLATGMTVTASVLTIDGVDTAVKVNIKYGGGDPPPE